MSLTPWLVGPSAQRAGSQAYPCLQRVLGGSGPARGLPAAKPLWVGSWDPGLPQDSLRLRPRLWPSAAIWRQCWPPLLPAPRDLQGRPAPRSAGFSGLPCTLPFVLAFTVRIKGGNPPGLEGKGSTCHFRSFHLNGTVRSSPHDAICQPSNTCWALWLRFADVLGKRKASR